MRPSLALTLLLGGALSLLTLISAAFPEWKVLWWLPLFVLLPALCDLLLTLASPAIGVSRTVAPLLLQGRAFTVVLSFAGAPAARLRVYDGVPETFKTRGLPAVVQGRAGEASLEYQFVPEARGTFAFGPAWIDHSSRWGLWTRRHRAGPVQSVRVFPDVRLATSDHLLMGGTVGPGAYNVRRRGQGMEFHQLREYRQGDMARSVDPKASSRLQKLVVREMQEEQDQNIIFLVDTGYRMTDTEDGVRHFDRVFEAMLSLASVALRQGDRVGVLTWGPDERWIPPVRGREAFPSLVEGLFDLQARAEASSPIAALQQVLPRLKRRSLVFLLTNFREEDGDELAPLLPLFRARHLLCTLWLKEKLVDDWKQRVPQDLDDALGTSMAAAYDEARARGRRRNESQGVLTIDVAPEHLRGDLIRKYWEVKKRGLL